MELIKQLKQQFTLKGVIYQQVEKNQEYVVYRCEDTNGNIYVEVFRYRLIRSNPKFQSSYDVCERYPTDEAFGDWAWCCYSRSEFRECMKRFNTYLVEEIADRAFGNAQLNVSESCIFAV